MCELFALSCAVPTPVTFSLGEFQRQGGNAHRNEDGWGIAYYEDEDARIVRDTEPAADSAYLAFLREHNIASPFMISHVREATQGDVRLKNTQPYARELWGRTHTFAHKGNLERDGVEASEKQQFTPVGDSDSEWAFCTLLQRIAAIPGDHTSKAHLEARIDVVRSFAGELKHLGIFNFVYCDGEYLFAHSHTRTGVDGMIGGPGLQLLERHTHSPDECDHHDVPGLHMMEQEHFQKMVLIASVALTEEEWTPLRPGTLAVLKDGELERLYTS